MTGRLGGRRAIVTGAASGIGFATVRVFAVTRTLAPGFVETPMTSTVPATLPDEIARAAFLDSHDAAFVTGRTPNVDGARTVGLGAG